MPEQRIFRVENGRIIYMEKKIFDEREKRVKESCIVKPMILIPMIRCTICQLKMAETDGEKHFKEYHSDLLRNDGAEILSSNDAGRKTIEMIALVCGDTDDVATENMVCRENFQAGMTETDKEEPEDQSDLWPCEKSENRSEEMSQMSRDSGIESNAQSQNGREDHFVDYEDADFTAEPKFLSSNTDACTCTTLDSEDGNIRMPALSAFYNELLESDHECFQTFNWGLMPTLEKEKLSSNSNDEELESDKVSSIYNVSSDDDSKMTDDDEKDEAVEFHSAHLYLEKLLSPTLQITDRLMWCKLCDSYFNSIYELKLHIRHYHKMDDSRVTRWNYATWDLEIARVFVQPEVEDSNMVF